MGDDMIKQGTEEWHKQRVGMITGSRVGAILGLNPWSSRDDVMREMVREYHGAEKEFIGNVATEHGKINEANAIFELEIEHDIEVKETGFHIHPDYPWLGASPDGLIGDSWVAEIKCPYGLRNDKDPKFKTSIEQPHYLAQMQIEMACAGRYSCYFYQWNQYANKLEVVYFDKEWLDENLPKLHEFYLEYLEIIKNPGEYIEDLVQLIPESVYADNYIAARDKLEEAKADLEEAKEQLIKLANGKKTKIGDLLIYPIERKGSISYAKAIKDLAPGADLSGYTGKPSTSWGVK